MPLFHRLRWPLFAVALVLAALSVRATVEQRAAWDRAVAFEREGRLTEAIDEYRWCLRWYTLWGPAHDDAADALRDLGSRLAVSDPERAVQALDNLRSGLIAGRHLWQPRSELVAHVNQTIPPLLVRVADRRGDKREPKALLARFTADYARPVGVGPWVSVAVALGFLLWLGGLVQVVRRGVDDQGRFTRAAWPWFGAALGGFGVWVLAMWVG